MIGTYLHGLFVNENIRHALMSHLHERKGVEYAPQVEDWELDAYEELVGVVRENVGVGRVCGIMGIDVWSFRQCYSIFTDVFADMHTTSHE